MPPPKDPRKRREWLRRQSESQKARWTLEVRKQQSERRKKFFREHPKAKQQVSKKLQGNRNAWKKSVGYHALHKRARKAIPKPALCVRCELRPPREVAATNTRYTKFEWTCRSCNRTDGIKRPKRFLDRGRQCV